MKHSIKAYCQGKPHAIEDYQSDWDATRFFIGGKMFALLGCHKTGEPIITLKCDPLEAAVLRARYPDIIPGYYMNKTHWNSVYLNGNVPKDEFFRMIDMSYALVFQSLPKKEQNRLKQTEAEDCR
ncbi:MAG: MmcQ/YjbR family DNA-binding protein [Bacillota bacterium]